MEGDCKAVLENNDDSDRYITKQHAVEFISRDNPSGEQLAAIEEPENFEDINKEEPRINIDPAIMDSATAAYCRGSQGRTRT